MPKGIRPEPDCAIKSTSALRRLLVMSPRILGILFIVFMGLFALDVFEGEGEILSMVLAFLIHLTPSYILIITLLLAWRFELLGAILYLGLSLLYIVATRGRQHWVTYATVSGTSLLLSILFLLNWGMHRKRKDTEE